MGSAIPMEATAEITTNTTPWLLQRYWGQSRVSTWWIHGGPRFPWRHGFHGVAGTAAATVEDSNRAPLLGMGMAKKITVDPHMPT